MRRRDALAALALGAAAPYGTALPSSLAALPPAAILYVDPLNGNDANNGRAWWLAVATVAKALSLVPAGGAVVNLAAGTHNITTQLLVPDGTTLWGQGPEATQLVWSTDLGSGACAIKPAGTGIQQNHRSYRSMMLSGSAGDITVGTSRASMDGLEIYRNDYLEDVYSSGFRAGFGIVGDHNIMVNCQGTNSMHGLSYQNSPVATGNQALYGCRFTGNAYSGIRIARDNIMSGDVLNGVHLANEPYGIFKDSAGGTGPIASACFQSEIFVFLEGIGNSFVDDASTDFTFYNCRVDMPNGSLSRTFQWGAQPSNFTMNCNAIHNSRFFTGDGIPAGAVGQWAVNNSDRGWDVYTATLGTAPLGTAANHSDLGAVFHLAGDRTLVFALPAAASTIATGDLLCFNTSGEAQRATAALGIIGVALTASSVEGTPVFVQNNGFAQVTLNYDGMAPTQGQSLVQSGTNAYHVQAGTGSTGLAVATAAGSFGTVPATLTLT
jgi:hypothetical protein